MQNETKVLHLKIMHHLSAVFKKTVVQWQIDNAEDLDVVMPMYNLLEYSKNYRKSTESLWNYYRDEPSNPLFSNSESFKYKASITGNTYDGDDDEDKVGKNETEVVIPIKHLSIFWKNLNIRLINCELELL